MELMQHPFHKHPLSLVLVDETARSSNELLWCSGCRGVIVSASMSSPSYRCLERSCNFQLHKKCAEAPFQLDHHPLHANHSNGLFLRKGPARESEHQGYVCRLCMQKHNMFFYECRSCWYALDINCALSSYDSQINPYWKQYDVHIDPLILIQNLQFQLKTLDCSLCHQPLVGDICICVVSCGFGLHKKCLDEFPTKINHPSHRIHPLILKSNPYSFCKLCQMKHDGPFYCCPPCNFSIGIECAWPRPIINVEDKIISNTHHQHPFTLLLSQPSFSFICDACGTEGNNCMCYICCTCDIMVHKECTSLPPTLRISLHRHPISHKYLVQKQAVSIAAYDDDIQLELDGEDVQMSCQICFNKVKKEHGIYSCMKQDCNYIVHVKCAIEKDDMYEIIYDDQQSKDELEEQEQEQADESNSAIIDIIEDGEGRKLVKHLLHEHYLMLEDKLKEKEVELVIATAGDGQCCGGCMLPISSTDPFYYCCNSQSQSQCHFLLHKACAELPKTMHHWFHRFVAKLESQDFLLCGFCNRQCSGFFYSSIIPSMSRVITFCLRCATIPYVFKCEAHQHPLLFDHKFESKCNGCGNLSCGFGIEDGLYRCSKQCSDFALDFACLTLPQSVKHRMDDHLLKLTYRDDDSNEEGDDFYDPYCDICEGKRNPNHWFYHCAICHNSAHPQCVLGNFPFLKPGITCPDWYHRHRDRNHHLIFVRNIDDYPRPNCSECGKHCQDEAFKCATCNYIAHCLCARS